MMGETCERRRVRGPRRVDVIADHFPIGRVLSPSGADATVRFNSTRDAFLILLVLLPSWATLSYTHITLR